MSDDQYDLLIHAGRIVCTVTGIDGPGAVAIRDGRIVAAGSDVTGPAHKTMSFDDALLLPGLVDLHAHPDRREFVDDPIHPRGSKYGVDPDVEFLPHGVTTVMSQGDAGPLDWNDYLAETINTSRTRVRLAINLASCAESVSHGCFENLDDIDVDACVSAIEKGGHLIWGIAVNVSRIACQETDPREVMKLALTAAERSNRPLLYGMRNPNDWSFEEQMELLRAGDVVTYSFRSEPNGIVADGHVHPAIRAAREKGVLFDVGHGMGSFDFDIVEAAVADGFFPDTISTDQYARHSGSQPQHDLPRTMSKLLAAGMPETELFAAVTARPAKVLGLQGEVGTLAAGAVADLAILNWNENAAVLVDVNGLERSGGCWEPLATIRAGEVI